MDEEGYRDLSKLFRIVLTHFQIHGLFRFHQHVSLFNQWLIDCIFCFISSFYLVDMSGDLPFILQVHFRLATAKKKTRASTNVLQRTPSASRYRTCPPFTSEVTIDRLVSSRPSFFFVICIIKYEWSFLIRLCVFFFSFQFPQCSSSSTTLLFHAVPIHLRSEARLFAQYYVRGRWLSYAVCQVA